MKRKAVLWLAVLALGATPAQASLISLAASGTISSAGMRRRSPSRTTVDSGAASAISARTDRSARAS